ncbi:hypothetical protein G6F22_005409 [Rhizopus arrhizus]|nr:hypothetical protein G6F22_005409 [Rhizopus arrhizus]KAG0803862.1 hypothetical protein G6F20_013155 [Rhizopus arrhizus]KAG0821784.1 hypothetical protein G6F19_011741 [Rhizopus arrhizus]KAG0869878.1 hypothetical protein G6F15_011802 [Rhizopus arrhizus]KAG0885702.1 hypothetical protein G6F34_013210 [Rhizopus arrhizus]
MKERAQKLQAKFPLRSVDAPDDTLLSRYLPYLRISASHSQWYKLSKTTVWLSTKHILKTTLIQGVARLIRSSSLFAAQIWV